jgi:ribosomal-protein-alanine N-acetyltransferase
LIGLATERLELHAVPRERSFVPALHELLRDPEVMRWMNVPPHRDTWETERYLGAWSEHAHYGRGQACAVYERQGPVFVGLLTLSAESPHSVAFGGYLHRSAQRKGYAVEVTRAVTEWALANERTYRVSAQCDVRNDGASKVLERAGFTCEGVLKRAWEGFGEEPRDVFSYSVTR